MIEIALNWLYISFISFIYGFLFLDFWEKRFKYTIHSLSSYIWAGIVVLTVYAQIFSLFAGVGLLANILLVVLALVIVLVKRRRMKEKLVLCKLGKAKTAGISIVLLLMLYSTSRGYMAYDTGLYHAQAIRWIEEYGVVPGLGLLHSRFAYNSSSFALSALFSFSFLPIAPLHAVSGYLAFLLGCSSINVFMAVKRKKMLLSDFVRVGALYYITLVFNEVVSPASDYFAMVTVFYIALKWAELIDREEKDATPYALLCVMSAFAISLKLSAGFLVFLMIQPIILLIKSNKSKQIYTYLLIGILVVLPFLIRGVIISGWLLYPTTALDVFNVPWKIPKEVAIAEANEIKAWGRGLQNFATADVSLREWTSVWFKSQSILTKGMLVLDTVGLICGAVMALMVFIKKRYRHLPCILFGAVIYSSFTMWLVTAPLARYGYAYIILPFLIVFGYLLAQSGKKMQYICMAVSLAFLLFKGATVMKYITETCKEPYYLTQLKYEEYALDTYEVNGITFYLPSEGDRVGYDSFPAAPLPFAGELRGSSLQDGFQNRD